LHLKNNSKLVLRGDGILYYVLVVVVVVVVAVAASVAKVVVKE